MKNIVLALFFVLLLGNSVNAQQPTFEPQWSEFCPPDYLDVQYTDKTFAILATTREKRKDNNYWAKRRQEFNMSVMQCRQYPGEYINQCFYNIRAQEMNKNQVYYAQKQEETAKRQMRMNYLQTQQAINAINKPQQYYHQHNVNVYRY